MARLEEICSLITDGSHFSPEDEGVGYPMFSVKDMTPNGFNISECKKIGEEAYKKLVANGCKPLNDDVVVAKDGSYLKTAFVIKGNPEIALLSSIAILRPQIDLVVPEYLSYFLKSDAVYRTVSLNYITGTALKRIILKGIRKIEVDLPDIGEQEQRAQRLSKVDYLCQLRKQQLAKLDKLVKARFVEMFGDFKNNSKNWPIVKFDELAKIDGNMTTDYEKYADYPHIGIDSIEKETGELKGYRTVKEDGVVSGKYIFTPQHIIYSKIRPNLNKVALPDFEGLCSADAYPILPNPKNCNRIFLALAMRSDYFLDYILQFSARTNLPKVNRKEIAGFSMPLPPLSLQNDFATFVERVNQQKQTVQQSLEKLELMKKALMQEYFG